MRIALLADIHGNLPALEAVMAELERLQPDYVVLDGDLINAVPFSGEVIDRVRATNWAVVRGNHEFYYLDFGTQRAASGSDDPNRWGQLHWLIERITRAQGAYLAALPDERTLYFPGTQPIRVAHGVPGRNRVGFYQQQPVEKIIAEIDTIPQRTLVSAHTHVQIDRHVSLDPDPEWDFFADPHGDSHHAEDRPANTHWHVVNPGSVGLPLDGDPRAQLALLESVPEHQELGGWSATHYRIEYDRCAALVAFEETGMMEAGGVISKLFYWELVTAEPEIILYHHWARDNGFDPEEQVVRAFTAYVQATGRDQYVGQRDPLQRTR